MTSRSSSLGAILMTTSTDFDAKFNVSGDDMYWSIWGGPDGFVRWTGYDDANWWDKVPMTPQWRTRVGKTSGRRFVLDPDTMKVTIVNPPKEVKW